MGTASVGGRCSSVRDWHGFGRRQSVGAGMASVGGRASATGTASVGGRAGRAGLGRRNARDEARQRGGRTAASLAVVGRRSARGAAARQGPGVGSSGSGSSGTSSRSSSDRASASMLGNGASAGVAATGAARDLQAPASSRRLRLARPAARDRANRRGRDRPGCLLRRLCGPAELARRYRNRKPPPPIRIASRTTSAQYLANTLITSSSPSRPSATGR